MSTLRNTISFAGLAAVIILLSSSCQSGGDSSKVLVTANNESIKLMPGDKPLELKYMDKATFEKYDLYFNSATNYQAPLNKIFINRGCTYYYGIPVSNSVADLYRQFSEKYGNRIITETLLADTTEGKIMARDSVYFILAEIVKTPGKSILLTGVISTDSVRIRDHYEKSDLKTRIINGK